MATNTTAACRINLHNHTTWSDGRFAPEEVVQAAIAGGLTHVGISDHFKTAKLSATASFVGIDFLDAYIQEVRGLAQRYAGQVRVLCGLEVDFSERTPMDQFWQRGFRRTPLNGLDYVLFEYVSNPDWRGLPLSALVAYRRWLQVPVGLAHTFFGQGFSGAGNAVDLARTLAEQRIFIELSTASPYTTVSSQTGRRVPYYRSDDAYTTALWAALREREVLFSIGSDAHADLAEVADIADAWAFLRERGWEDRLVTARYWR
ncbi:MAG: PHP domain-containing protein [Chloroflexi bacterium]|nr:PHP domain-containing protein [Chloroflexota bacterium]